LKKRLEGCPNGIFSRQKRMQISCADSWKREGKMRKRRFDPADFNRKKCNQGNSQDVKSCKRRFFGGAVLQND